jgi:Hg(II)-responsive transcriptional regulator
MDTLTLGALAKCTGVHLETIRYYEREGLIPEPARKPSGHRIYLPSAVQRLRFIRRVQELGFTLAEIRELLSLRAEAGRDCGDVCRRAQTKLDDVREKIRQLKAIETALTALTDNCSGDRPVNECGILEALDADL